MTPADLPDFERFFTALQGYSPFPWQVRAARLLAGRRTAAVGVPTGLGKSALIDAAVWAAAQGGWRRIAYVVDRRIVVDDLAQRPRNAVFGGSGGGVVGCVHDGLQQVRRRCPAPARG